MASFCKGDHVVYHADKTSARPGRRAEDIYPSEHGEDYSYTVDKYWTVMALEGDEVVVRTRTGKTRRINVDDRRLRKASFLEKMRYAKRFPGLAHSVETDEGPRPPE